MGSERAGPIDIWDLSTFDRELLELLKANEALIRDYTEEENRIFLGYDLGRDQTLHLRPSNRYWDDHHELEKCLAAKMAERSIRAFHYTRLTEAEIGKLQNQGIHLSTQDSLKDRLAGQVEAGAFSEEIASRLYDLSPLRSGQENNRSGMFWLSALPLSVDDGGVERLLSHWGGEAVYMWLEDRSLIELVQSIGKKFVIEACVPLSATKHAYDAAQAVMETFARSLKLHPENKTFDVCVRSDLPSEAIFKIHTEGEECFRKLGCGYPASYQRIDDFWWDED
ncbi:hypothetical protein [Thalassospira xiamenensis]|uniref:hypothetical protein n=1 Tax=Thalassospira xiamenensis TaxID=220697 RepID=UPI000DED9F8C|nr:hypothetical protein [Thalassospira xiamenensis]RCK39991.1 hypothetical protein TH24_11510 [Thalassospira xiamenensis]